MNIAIIGYGKMGKEIALIAKKRNHTIGLIIDKNNPEDLNSENLKNIDLAIEFSTPGTALTNYFSCFASNIPVVSGTTGWLSDFDQIEQKCLTESKSFFYASNFSLGVNLFFKLNEFLAQLMGGHKNYSINLQEIHHTEKLDSPSGTAISLANQILENSDTKTKWTNSNSTNVTDLIIESVRKPEVPGTHHVSYESGEDLLQLTHVAKSRQGFALGAVLAAEYLHGKVGLFNMNDLLKL